MSETLDERLQKVSKTRIAKDGRFVSGAYDDHKHGR